MSKNKSIDDIKKVFEEKEEQDLNNRMDNNTIQLKLWDDEGNIPFYSQDLIERKAVFLPNSSRQSSFVVAKSDFLKITIGKAGGHKDYGVLKTKHRDVLYAVLAIWASQNWAVWNNKEGLRLGVVKTSKYRILSLLLKKNPGKNDYKSLMDTLYDLKVIPVEIEDLSSEDTREVFSIFSSYEYSSDGESDLISIYLNPRITKQYYAQRDLKLLFFDTYRGFSSDTAKVLYPIIDRVLSHRNEFTKKVLDICNENGLTVYRFNTINVGIY